MSELKEKIVSEIKKIYDPEIPVNIYELGLIYKIEIDDTNKVEVEMVMKQKAKSNSMKQILTILVRKKEHKRGYS